MMADNISSMLKILDGTADTDIAEKYIGKMLFELVSAAKKKGVDPELALTKYSNSFIEDSDKH